MGIIPVMILRRGKVASTAATMGIPVPALRIHRAGKQTLCVILPSHKAIMETSEASKESSKVTKQISKAKITFYSQPDLFCWQVYRHYCLVHRHCGLVHSFCDQVHRHGGQGERPGRLALRSPLHLRRLKHPASCRNVDAAALAEGAGDARFAEGFLEGAAG